MWVRIIYLVQTHGLCLYSEYKYDIIETQMRNCGELVFMCVRDDSLVPCIYETCDMNRTTIYGVRYNCIVRILHEKHDVLVLEYK